MTTTKLHTSIDEWLVKFFAEIDPDQIIPDEISYSADRSRQHKAPDHFMFDRRILVERKTIQTSEEAIIERFNNVTEKQNARFITFGQQSLDGLLKTLDDPDKAMDDFAKATVNKFEQRIKKARDKFREHAEATGVSAACRFVVCSEDGDSSVNDGVMFEQHIARMFWGRHSNRDKTGLIDSIVYIRDPQYTISGGSGHWFKWLTRKDITAEQRNDISSFGKTIFSHLITHFRECGRDISQFGEVKHWIV